MDLFDSFDFDMQVVAEKVSHLCSQDPLTLPKEGQIPAP